MDFLQGVILSMFVLNVVFAFIMFLHGRKSWPETFFSFLILNVGLWSLAVFLLIYPGVSLGYFKFGAILHFWGGNLIFLAFFWFALFYKQENPSRLWAWLITAVDLLFLCLIAFTDFLFSSISQSGSLDQSLIFDPKGYALYSIFLFCLFIFSELLMLKRYQKTFGNDKKQLGLIILGTFVAGLMGQTTNLILPAFGFFGLFSFGPIFSTIFVSIIGYAILRHGLFNLKIIATEIFTLILVVSTSVELFTASNAFERFEKGTILGITVLFGYFLIRSVYREVHSREEIERLAHDLERANIELKRLDQAKSEFISIASHQLRTPLTIIKGYLSMIREGSYGEFSGQIGSTLNKVYLSNERLIKLVNDLLDLSRMESGRMKYEFAEMDLKALTDSIVDEFQLPAKDKGIKISWIPSQADGLPKISGDAWKLRQVIFNLIDNSLKYTNAGGIEIKLEKEDDSLKLSVKDSGIGMSQETAGAVFHKFVRGGKEASKVNAGGTGLGLYIAKRIVDDHKGEIWAESPGEGKGSTFFVRMPLTAK